MNANETLNQQIKALKDTYMDMLETCDKYIDNSNEEGKEYFIDVKNRIKIKMMELDILLTK